MQIEHLTTDSTVLRVGGVIDTETAPGVERKLKAEFETTSYAVNVLLDLSSVVLLDLPGLDVLLRLQCMIENGRGTIKLLDPTPSVLRLLHEAQLDGQGGEERSNDP